YRDIGIAAHGPFFHIAVADVEVAEYFPDFGEIGIGFVGAVDIGLRHHFDQGGACPVEVYGSIIGVYIVQALAGVFFEVDTVKPDVPLARFGPDADVSSFTNGSRMLGDLVAFWQIGVEVILPGEIIIPFYSA